MSLIFRSIDSPLWSGLLVAAGDLAARPGAGNMSAMKSSIASLPILCSAELSSTGKMRLAWTASRRPFLQIFDRQRALRRKTPASARRRLPRPFPPALSCAALAASARSAGNLFDLRLAVAVGRVRSAPSWRPDPPRPETLSPRRSAVAPAPRRGRTPAATDSSARSKLASSRSIQLMTKARGRSYSVA